MNILPPPAIPAISCPKSPSSLFHPLVIPVLSCTRFITSLPRASKTVPGSKPRAGALLSKCGPENIKWGHTPGSRVALLCHQISEWGAPHPQLWSKQRLETDKEPLPPQKICLGFAVKHSQHDTGQTHTQTHSAPCLQDLCCGFVYSPVQSLIRLMTSVNGSVPANALLKYLWYMPSFKVSQLICPSDSLDGTLNLILWCTHKCCSHLF